MNNNELQKIIESAWENRESINPQTGGEIAEAVNDSINLLDTGNAKIVEKQGKEWVVNQWLKKAVLLSFRTTPSKIFEAAQNGSNWYDKTPSKFLDWQEKHFKQAELRAVPGCYVRKSAYIAPNVVLMPCFVNLGAYIDEGSMIDTWATIGSCAHIGKNCHISGGAGIGGVLEPLQANPVIIEDNCFIGARSEVAEGVIVGEGSVISMGVYIGASTKIIDRETDEITYGKVPPYSVVVPGNFGKSDSNLSLYCAVIVKKVDAKTRSKTSVNELLRVS